MSPVGKILIYYHGQLYFLFKRVPILHTFIVCHEPDVVSPSPPVPPGHRLLQPSLGLQHHVSSMHRPELYLRRIIEGVIGPTVRRNRELDEHTAADGCMVQHVKVKERFQEILSDTHPRTGQKRQVMYVGT